MYKLKSFKQFLNEFEIEGEPQQYVDARGLLHNIVDKTFEKHGWGNIKLTINGEDYYTFGFDDVDKDVYDVGITSDHNGTIVTFSYRPYNEFIYNIPPVTSEQYNILQLVYNDL